MVIKNYFYWKTKPHISFKRFWFIGWNFNPVDNIFEFLKYIILLFKVTLIKKPGLDLTDQSNLDSNKCRTKSDNPSTCNRTLETYQPSQNLYKHLTV